ncbi:MAG: recombinase family protein [Vulcanimicrobiota bacterium]
MSGQAIGYKRVSTTDQSTERQLDGMVFDEVFEDKASGKNLDRPQFDAMLKHLRKGDHLFVHSMDRLARNLGDLLKTVEQLTSKGVEVSFKKECLDFKPDAAANPMAKLMLSMMGAFAEFERSLIRERQREGIAVAKQRGVYRGRKRALDLSQIEQIKTRLGQGEQVSKVAREYGLTRQTIYRTLERTEATSGNSKERL